MKNIFKMIKPFIIKYSPEILKGMGISSLIAATVYSVRATLCSKQAVEDKKKEENVDELTSKEIIKTCWKYYIPSGLLIIGGVVFIFCGDRIHIKRNMAIAAAYQLSEAAFIEYQNKTKEIVGEQKERSIHEAISKDNIEKINTNNLIIASDTETLFYDPLSDRVFKNEIENVKSIINKLNYEINTSFGGAVRVNDLYDELNIPRTDAGRYLGWSLETGLINVEYDAHLTEDNKPCIALYFRNYPRELC